MNRKKCGLQPILDFVNLLNVHNLHILKLAWIKFHASYSCKSNIFPEQFPGLISHSLASKLAKPSFLYALNYVLLS